MRRILFWTTVVLLALGGALALGVRRDLPAAELEARYAQPPSRFLEVDGLRVHYRDEGQGPTLLLLHGSNAALFTWERWTRELSGRFRVISLDLPGHGLTGPDPQGRYSASDMANFLEAFRARLGLERFHLAGNSMGGSVAWHYALLYPERVERLVLVDSAGYPREEPAPLVFRLVRMPVLGELLSQVTPRLVVEKNLRAIYGDPSKVTDAQVERYHELLLREGNREATRERMRLDGDELWRRLGELKHPTLILWGEKDAWILPKYAHRFAELIPHSRLVLYPDLGHIPMEEDPVRTAADVTRFLDESAPTMNPLPVASSSSEPVDGLQVRLEPPAEAQAGQELRLGLVFHNTRQTPLRIYLIQSEPFRFGQSTLAVLGADDKLVSLQPQPRPHGYVVTESDFRLLEPGAELRVEQTLSTRGLAAGECTLSWTYENHVSSWPGGAITMEGPTKALFGGGPIPFIWTGKVNVRARLAIR
jgi:pimeloyl-ACP methyl ester carboxylesterase